MGREEELINKGRKKRTQRRKMKTGIGGSKCGRVKEGDKRD